MEYKFKPVVTWPRKPTTARQRSQFSASYKSTLQLLEKELSHLDARNPVVIQTYMTERDIRHDDLPRSDARTPSNPGVIVTCEVFIPSGKVNELKQPLGSYKPISFPCDQFTDWKDNLRAIALALEALRKVDRYGVTKSGEQYKGWLALPPKPEEMSVDEAARYIAGHSGQSTSFILASKDNLEAAYKTAARRLHPDAGGKQDDFVRLQQAVEILRKKGA
jgi:hypothetical protein